MTQSRGMSALEALSNLVLGYAVAVAIQAFAFPMFGLHPSLHQHLGIATIFTLASIARSYIVRRLFAQREG